MISPLTKRLIVWFSSVLLLAPFVPQDGEFKRLSWVVSPPSRYQLFLQFTFIPLGDRPFMGGVVKTCGPLFNDSFGELFQVGFFREVDFPQHASIFFLQFFPFPSFSFSPESAPPATSSRVHPPKIERFFNICFTPFPTDERTYFGFSPQASLYFVPFCFILLNLRDTPDQGPLNLVPFSKIFSSQVGHFHISSLPPFFNHCRASAATPFSRCRGSSKRFFFFVS